MPDAAKQAVWICHFLSTISKRKRYGLQPLKLLFTKSEPTQLGVDTQGALVLASNPVNHP